MERRLIRHFMQEKRRAIEDCRECGLCIKKCAIIKHTSLKNSKAGDIQGKILAFLTSGEPNDAVFTRAFSCMECFGCVDECCPEGLNPLLINEIVKWEYRRHRFLEPFYGDPGAGDCDQRVLASIQTNPQEFKKILTPTGKETARHVFFPGCNIYFQPEKILNALDILDFITDDYAFLPGLDACCGDVHLFSGEVEKADEASEALIEKLASYHPACVIFWCPTCHCRFEKFIAPAREIRSRNRNETSSHQFIAPAREIPFQFMSFAQFLARHMDDLPFKKEIRKTVTLHEACKSALTGVDLTGPRDVLKKIPGMHLMEMPRHGKEAVCCGSGAVSFFPESSKAVRDERLEEAARMRTDLLADVCHYCHHVFVTEESKYDFSVVNYLSLVAESLGVAREDKFKKYRQWMDPDKILGDAEPLAEKTPYSREKIKEVLKRNFTRRPETSLDDQRAGGTHGQ